MPNAICTNCQTSYTLKESGVFMIEMFADPPRPYKIWSADLHECPVCKNKIVNGYGQAPLAIQHQDNFPRLLDGIMNNGATVIYAYEMRRGQVVKE